MSRIVASVLSALALTACQPAVEPDAQAEIPNSGAATEGAAGTTSPEPVFDEAAFAALEERYLGKDKPTDPIEEFDWREVTCNFLGGEIGGEPEQDRAVNARIDELRCGQQNAEARALRAANPSDAALVARIDAYLARNTDPAP